MGWGNRMRSLARYFEIITAAMLVMPFWLPSVSSAEVLTAGAITSSTTRDGTCSAQFRVFEPVALTRLSILIPLFENCRSVIPDVKVTRAEPPFFGWIVEDLPAGFQGPADFLTCDFNVHHSECQPTLDSGDDIQVLEAIGPDGALESPPTICPVYIDCESWPCGTPGPYIADRCGDADDNTTITSADALVILRGAVGLNDCPSTICDVDMNSSVSSADSLRVLKASVGIVIPLVCPAPCTNVGG
jgi:hypothetical protein